MNLFSKAMLGLFTLVSLHVNAQTIEEIANKNTEAMGGAAKLASLNTVKMTGSMSAQGMEFPVSLTKVHQKGMRLDLEIMGTFNYQIMTTDKGYTFFPIQQMQEPKELSAEDVADAQGQLDIQGTLFNYKQKADKIEYVATEKIDGADAYKIKATTPKGKVTTMFIDVKTNRVIKSLSKVKSPDGQEVDVEVSYSNYKQNADGYWFPYLTTTMQGTITYDKIETNIKVEDSLFKN